jgi:alkylhydroperoxidase family enzyme
MPWVTWIETVDETTRNEEVQKLHQATRHPLTKTIPDTVRLTSLTPEVSGLLHELKGAIDRSSTGLTVREKEVAALVTAAYNGCVH